MYYYESIKGAILADGTRYAPRVHRQFLPFIVLKRTYATNGCGVNIPHAGIGFIDAFKYTIHGVREVMCARGGDRDNLAAIWEDSFSALLKIMNIFGVPVRREDYSDSVAALYEALKYVGYNPVTDSFYTPTNKKHFSVHRLAKILSYPLHLRTYGRSTQKIQRLTNSLIKHSVAQNRPAIPLNLAEYNEVEQDQLNYHFSRILEGVEKSGYYYTLRYFQAFSERFKLSGSLSTRITQALADHEYDTVILLDIRDELYQNYKNRELSYQAGIGILFSENSSTSYTSVFS